ncbi:efflux RND transporter periplasmic adaptor subunit [Tropicibacter oceani]|uniref:Efflux RND transporter periplasmic adaptor subunit n=1 Tax=Tropicibacter oceani TaxID=3058420 RepID=A0ABY8QIN7_9RHOB|nr:efflux RND transporter periplasmic adaptor subunit [Tropicibacter oceani]WGW04505.1 efflux RND transporter periplasmic adaptor subunit [Tropicibacter oceani]
MNDISHTSDILDQLKSLSIERVDPVAPARAQASRPRRRLPIKSLALLALLGGGGAAAWHHDVSGAQAMDWAQGLARETLPADYLPASWQTVPAAQAETAAPAVIETASPVAPPPAPVTAPSPAVVGSGYVVADRELMLMPDIGGRIQSLNIETGDHFDAGQEIAVLNSDTARTDLRIAQANLAMAQASAARAAASLDEAGADLARQEELLKRGSAPRTQVEAARFALARMQRDVDVATQQAEIARLEVEKHADIVARHTITAPFAGVVVKRHMNPGDIVVSALDGGPGQGIATLIDPTALTIEVDVAEGNLSSITPGQRARIELDAYPNRDFAAEVKTIAPKVSIQKGTVQVRLAFDTPPMGVFANMAAKVTFATSEQTAAIQQQGN